MDILGTGRSRNFLLGQKGQSAIEYILLLGVIFALGIGIIRSAYFEDFIGQDSRIFAKLERSIEFTYRHALFGESGDRADPNRHESYYNNQKNETRFFTSYDPGDD